MRNLRHKYNLLTAILVIYGVVFIVASAFAGVTFLGNTEKRNYGANRGLVATSFSCKNGQVMYNGNCVNQCDRSVYIYDQEGTEKPYDTQRGSALTCTDPFGSYFYYTDCNEGWNLVNSYCEVFPCTGFPYSSDPGSVAGNVVRCKRGAQTVYKYSSCNDGWDYDGVSDCVIRSCSSTDFPYTSHPGNDAGVVATCQSGVTTLYGYSSCKDGWNKSNGYCNVRICDATVFPYTSSQSSEIGVVASCKSGSDIRYGFTSCNDGWSLVNHQCIVNTCAGFNSTSQFITGCQATSHCQAGTTTKYKCTACSEGYDLDVNNNCVSSCAYTASDLPSNCTAASSCQRVEGGVTQTYYSTTCTACEDGYSLSNGSCVPNSCSGYVESSSSCGGYCCNTCMSGSTKKYKVVFCRQGQYISGTNSCGVCETDGYIYKQCYAGTTCAKATCFGNMTNARNIDDNCSGLYGTSDYYKITSAPSTTCNVGDIYYSDDTCSSSYNSSKTPIGIVVNPYARAVMSLGESAMYWNAGSGTSCTVSGLSSPSGSSLLNDVNGEGNTNKILAYNSSYAAASYCHSMTTGGKSWHLPAAGEIRTAGMDFDLINTNIAKLNGAGGATAITKTKYWTSNIYSSSKTYYADLSSKDGGFYVGSFSMRNYDSCDKSYNVRCFFIYTGPGEMIVESGDDPSSIFN